MLKNQHKEEIVDDALKKFTIGFANSIEKAQSGQIRRSKVDRVQVTSFCLLTELPSSTPYKEIYMILICCVKNKCGEGSELLLRVIDYAKQNKFNKLSLHSLNEKKLLDWYLYHGFKIIETIYEGSEVKAIKLAIDLL